MTIEKRSLILQTAIRKIEDLRALGKPIDRDAIFARLNAELDEKDSIEEQERAKREQEARTKKDIEKTLQLMQAKARETQKPISWIIPLEEGTMEEPINDNEDPENPYRVQSISTHNPTEGETVLFDRSPVGTTVLDRAEEAPPQIKIQVVPFGNICPIYQLTPEGQSVPVKLNQVVSQTLPLVANNQIGYISFDND